MRFGTGGLAGGWVVVAALTLSATTSTPVLAASPFSGGGSAALAVCAAERAPLLEIEKQYDAVERSRLFTSVQAGVVGGATALIGSFALGGMLKGLPGGGSGGGSGNDLLGDLMKAGGGSSILGRAGGGGGTGQERALLVVVAALGTSVATYMTLKANDNANDRHALAMAIDQDAAGQIPLGRTTAAQARALTQCRTQQVAAFQQRLAAASDKDKRGMKREGDQIADAIKKDVALTDKVVGHQADLAKTFTQARAMSEGHSEADVLGGQKPAYVAAASTTPLQMPAATGTPAAPAAPPPPPPPPEVMLTVLRPAIARVSPSAKAKAVLTLPAKRQLKAQGMAAENGWWRIDVAGEPAYIAEASLSVSLSKPAAPAAPPAAAPPSNVREYNKVVLEARDEGPDRMRTLLTNFQ